MSITFAYKYENKMCEIFWEIYIFLLFHPGTLSRKIIREIDLCLHKYKKLYDSIKRIQVDLHMTLAATPTQFPVNISLSFLLFRTKRLLSKTFLATMYTFKYNSLNGLFCKQCPVPNVSLQLHANISKTSYKQKCVEQV